LNWKKLAIQWRPLAMFCIISIRKLNPCQLQFLLLITGIVVVTTVVVVELTTVAVVTTVVVVVLGGAVTVVVEVRVVVDVYVTGLVTV
jgi:hypothetical protein